MNRNEKILILILLISVFIIPSNVIAKSKQTSEGSCTNKNPNELCSKQVGINIKMGKYTRNTSTTSNDVPPRKITIIPNDNDIEYKALMIITDEGKMEELDLNAKISSKSKTLKELKEEIEDIDDDINVKRKTFKGRYDGWSLGSGKEAMIIVMLIDKSKRSDCCKYKDGKCVEKLSCQKGDFSIGKNDEIKEIKLTGNAAFIYVENPKYNGLVTNIRKNDKACKLGLEGIYNDDNDNLGLSSWGGNSETWRAKYFNIFLEYCNQESVAFNLDEDQIKEVSNQLYNIYKYQQGLKNGTSKSVKEIESIADGVKNNIMKTYCQGKEESQCSNIKKKNTSVDLYCKDKILTNSQEEYLYEEEDKQTVTLSNGNTPTVCNTYCYEHLTVSYDPPVASKAGICFPYKVTVKSKTECGVNVNEDILESLDTKTMCSPIPICENKENKTQAGPTDDFDECVNQCDNGQYSQKCINKCYNKVYKEKSSSNNSNNEKENASKMNLNQTKVNAIQIKTSQNCGKSDKCFTEYYDENYTASDCKTDDIIRYVDNNNETKIEQCAKYFMKAKLSDSKGTYNVRGLSEPDVEWGELDWKPYKPDINDKNVASIKTEDIPMSIGRASPFYFRDLKESINTLKSLVEPKNKGPFWKKYNITSNGIKRQYSERWKCGETCYYTGCKKTDVYTSDAYTKELIGDLTKISNALSKCNTTSACDTTEKKASFDIKIDNKRDDKTNTEGKITKIENKGSNTSGDGVTLVNNEGTTDTTVYGNSTSSQCKKLSMFVPANEAENSTNGILGLCYVGKEKNGEYEMHYQTTITFPGSWIDLKTGSVVYNCINEDYLIRKEQKYCLTSDSSDINKAWWKWRVYKNETKYPYTAPENTNNIKANIKKFGKYNWNIDFSCFYGIYNGDGNQDNVTKLNNYSFKPYKRGELFDGTASEKIGYNWTSAAKIYTIVDTNNSAAMSYAIDPTKYIERLNTEEKDEISDSDLTNSDYHIKLTADNIKQLKSYGKNSTYTSFEGRFNKKFKNVKGLESLSIYSSKILKNTSYVSSFTEKSGISGKNNDGLEGLN